MSVKCTLMGAASFCLGVCPDCAIKATPAQTTEPSATNLVHLFLYVERLFVFVIFGIPRWSGGSAQTYLNKFNAGPRASQLVVCLERIRVSGQQSKAQIAVTAAGPPGASVDSPPAASRALFPKPLQYDSRPARRPHYSL